MEPAKISGGKGPEWYIQKDIIRMLEGYGWFVRATHGNAYQNGFPDLYCCHPRYGARWVECKNPKKYAFTTAQLEVFPLFCASGAGIWVLTAATESEYKKLFAKHNYWLYLSVMK